MMRAGLNSHIRLSATLGDLKLRQLMNHSFEGGKPIPRAKHMYNRLQDKPEGLEEPHMSQDASKVYFPQP
jgi:hypothetical protein